MFPQPSLVPAPRTDPSRPGTATPVWSSAMLSLHDPSLLSLEMHERQRQAEQHNRAARLVAARKWERRAAAAARRARLARAAVV